MNKYFLIFALSVFIASCSQVLLKKSANRKYVRTIFEYLNPLVIIGYFFFLLSTLLAVCAYKKVPLKYGPVVESFGFLFILLFDRLIFKVHISKQKLEGAFLIIIGSIVFNLGEFV
jgi:multidrug transporter EmrE-like cation transporter